MPILQDLDSRLDSPPFDRAEFDCRLPASKAVADRVPLVHVCEYEWLKTIIATAPHELSTSLPGGTTQLAEQKLGVNPSVYFYAGRACPKFGDVVFAFPPDIERTRSGAATPFDTGGVLSDKLHAGLNLQPPYGANDRIKYCRDSQLALSDWREAFAEFLAAYFDEDVEYWLRPPRRPDRHQRHVLDKDWRAWTFEIRLESGPSIHDRVAWCGHQPTMDRIRQEHLRGPLAVVDIASTPFGRFWLSGPMPLDVSGASDFCERLEMWIRSELGM